jgi:hypothetical protein
MTDEAPRITIPVKMSAGEPRMNASVPMATDSEVGDAVALIPTGDRTMPYAASPLRVPEIGEPVAIIRIRNVDGRIEYVGIPMMLELVPLPTYEGISSGGPGGKIWAIHAGPDPADWVAVSRSGYSGGSAFRVRLSRSDGRTWGTWADLTDFPALSFLDVGTWRYFLAPGPHIGEYDVDREAGGVGNYTWGGFTNVWHYVAYSMLIHPNCPTYATVFGYMITNIGGEWGTGSYRDYLSAINHWEELVPGWWIIEQTYPGDPLHNSPTYTNQHEQTNQPPTYPVWYPSVANCTAALMPRAVGSGSRLIYHYPDSPLYSELWPERTEIEHDLSATGGIHEFQSCGGLVVVGTNGTDTIYVSRDGFVTYEVQHSQHASHLGPIGSNELDEIWIVDMVDPIAIRSRDAGATWERLDLPATVGHYTAVEHCGTFVLFGTDQGYLVRYNYEAPAWIPYQDSTFQNLVCSGNVDIYAASAVGTLGIAGVYQSLTGPYLQIRSRYIPDYGYRETPFAIDASVQLPHTGQVTGIYGYLMIIPKLPDSTLNRSATISVNGVTVATIALDGFQTTGTAVFFDVDFAAPITNPVLTISANLNYSSFWIAPEVLLLTAGLYDTFWKTG